MSQNRGTPPYDRQNAKYYPGDESTDDERMRASSLSSRAPSSAGDYDRLSSVGPGYSHEDYASGADRDAPVRRIRRPGASDQPYRFGVSRFTDYQGRLRDLDYLNAARRNEQPPRARPGSIECGSRRYHEMLHDDLRRGVTSAITEAEDAYLRERGLDRVARRERGESVSSDNWTDGSLWSSRPSSQQGPVSQGSSRPPSQQGPMLYGFPRPASTQDRFPNPFAQPPEPGPPLGQANPYFSPRRRTPGRSVQPNGRSGSSAQGSSSGQRSGGNQVQSGNGNRYTPRRYERDDEPDSDYSCGQPRP